MIRMSRFYKELHNRELLAQAVLLLQELSDRKMVDVFLPDDQTRGQTVFPRRLASVSVQNNKLALSIETEFFRKAVTAGRTP